MTAFPDVPHMELSPWQQVFLGDPGASAPTLNSVVPNSPRIGKTVALVHLYLRRAWENPGEWVKVEDHCATRVAHSNLFGLLQGTVVKAGLAPAMAFNGSHRSFRVSDPTRVLPSLAVP
jgi:hypothetical protein